MARVSVQGNAKRLSKRKTSTSDKPRVRAERNKRPLQGIKNRVDGICKKLNTLNRLYGLDAIVMVRSEDGDFRGYQSRPELLREVQTSPGSDTRLLTPFDFPEESSSYQSSRAPQRSTRSPESTWSSDNDLTSHSPGSQSSGSSCAPKASLASQSTQRRLSNQQKLEIIGLLSWL
jgi:hypothetical protein